MGLPTCPEPFAYGGKSYIVKPPLIWIPRDQGPRVNYVWIRWGHRIQLFETLYIRTKQ